MTSLMRRLAAIAVLGFYAYFFFDYARYSPPMMAKPLWALSALYGVAMLGVSFGWFWGRWFARGLGYWGIVLGVMMMWQLGVENFLVFWAATNAAVALLLAGDSMAAKFDGRLDWRSRFHIDENGAERLGKSVTRVGMSLPWLLLYILLPRPGGAELAPLMGLIPLALAGAGLWGILRMRTWGLFAIGGASLATTAQLATASHPPMILVLAALLLAGAVAPFAGALVARLR